MGWTGTHATHYKYRNGREVVDVRAECDSYWAHDHGRFKVLKSALVGSVYYAAIAICKEWSEGKDRTSENLVEVPEAEREVFGVVFLTSVDHKDYFNLHYKEMSENCGPCEDHCPIGIINLLTPTGHEFANDWRNRCRAYAKRKSSPTHPSNLPVGTKIRYNDSNGEVILEKRSPAYQFKTPWWYNAEKHQYVSKKRIPENFEIIKEK